MRKSLTPPPRSGTGAPLMRRTAAVALVIAAGVAGCTLRSVREAPIVDRSSSRAAPAAPVAEVAPTTPAPAVLQREATGGTYVVQRGDTLYSVAVAFGQDYRDLARWNNLEDPTRLAVGQTLRVTPPEAGSAQAGPVVGVISAAPSSVETKPLEPTPLPPAPPTRPADSGVAPAPAPSAAPGPAAPAPSAPAPPGAEPVPRPAAPPAAATQDSGVLWLWPARGKVIETYSEGRNKGIDIAGAEGDPVLAAGDGEVVYSGSGLRGYGNLVIVKHTEDYISAYAHNRQVLVKQGDPVRRGQRIAELGKTDATHPKLHFEIRHRGKPVDPMKFLPAR